MLRSAERGRARPQSGSTASGGPPAPARTGRCRAKSLASLLLAAVMVAGACAQPASPDEVLGPRAVRTQAVAVARLSGLVVAVQLERSVASVEVVDMAGPVTLPADSTEARRQTDAAIAEFTATLAEDDPIAAAYRPAAGALAQLETLRRDIDTGEAPRNELNLDAAHEIALRYSEPIMSLLDAHVTASGIIDEPELRRTAELIGLSLRQIEITELLASYALVAGLSDGGVDQPDEIGELSRLRAQTDRGPQDVMRLAAGSEHAGAARDLEGALEAARLQELIGEALETGHVDVVALMEAPAEALDPWHRFLNRLLAALPTGP